MMSTQTITHDEKKHFEKLALATRSHAISDDRLQELDDYLTKLRLSLKDKRAYVKPLAGAVAVNVGCNSKCSYCTICDMPIENTPINDLLMAVDQLANIGVFNMGITGGEPLLHPDLPRLIKHIDSYHLYSYLHSNGILWHPKKIEEFMESGLNALVLSLDTQMPDLYKRLRGIPIDIVLQNIDHAISIGERYPNTEIMINCVVNKINIKYLGSLVEWCSSKGISVGFQPIHPDFWSHDDSSKMNFSGADYDLVKDVFDNLVDMKLNGMPINNNKEYLDGFANYLAYRNLPDGFSCTTGYTVIQIDHKLNVKSCWYMRSLGNVHDQELKEIWMSERYDEQREKMVSMNCPKCWMRRHTELRSEEWLEEFIQNIVNNTISCE